VPLLFLRFFLHGLSTIGAPSAVSFGVPLSASNPPLFLLVVNHLSWPGRHVKWEHDVTDLLQFIFASLDTIPPPKCSRSLLTCLQHSSDSRIDLGGALPFEEPLSPSCIFFILVFQFPPLGPFCFSFLSCMKTSLTDRKRHWVPLLELARVFFPCHKTEIW